MVQLYFRAQGFARTITREEWKEIWRWKRVTQKVLDAELEKRMRNLVLFGTTHPELFDQITNPPLVMHDKQGL